ncbi:hypothetical protein ScPMuIL_009788 [Solemya velum]
MDPTKEGLKTIHTTQRQTDAGDYDEETSDNVVSGMPENKSSDSDNVHRSCRLERKWVVLVVCFLGYTLIPGFGASLGALYPQMLDEFGASRAQTGSVQATCIGMIGMSGMITGAICQWLGPRKAGIFGGVFCSICLTVSYFATSIVFLIITIGVFGGFGFSVVYVVVTVGPAIFFEGKALAFAMAFVTTGLAVGGLVFPYILTYLTDEFGLKGTFLIYGGILMNIIPASTIIHNTQIDTAKSKQQSSDDVIDRSAKSRLKCFFFDLKKLLKNPAYIIFMPGLASSLACLSLSIIVVTDYMVSLGYDNSTGVFVLTLMNGVSIISRLIPPFLKLIPDFPVLWIPLVFSIPGGLAMMSLPLTSSYMTTVVCLIITTLGHGTLVTMLSLVSMELVDMRMYPVAFGLLISVVGCGITASGPMSGMLKDSTGVYDLAFYLGGGFCLAGSIAMILSNCLFPEKRECVQGSRRKDNESQCAKCSRRKENESHFALCSRRKESGSHCAQYSRRKESRHRHTQCSGERRVNLSVTSVPGERRVDLTVPSVPERGAWISLCPVFRREESGSHCAQCSGERRVDLTVPSVPGERRVDLTVPSVPERGEWISLCPVFRREETGSHCAQCSRRKCFRRKESGSKRDQCFRGKVSGSKCTQGSRRKDNRSQCAKCSRRKESGSKFDQCSRREDSGSHCAQCSRREDLTVPSVPEREEWISLCQVFSEKREWISLRPVFPERGEWL